MWPGRDFVEGVVAVIDDPDISIGVDGDSLGIGEAAGFKPPMAQLLLVWLVVSRFPPGGRR